MARMLERGTVLYPKKLDQVVWKVIDGNGILLNLKNGAYFETNPVGLAIWKTCDGQMALEQIIRSIAATFHADSARVARDTRQFVAELKRRQLITVSPRPTR